MTQLDLGFTIDFSSSYRDETQEDIAAIINIAVEELPKLVPGASVNSVERNTDGIMGLEWLPALEILVSAPALLILLREIGRIVSEKLGTKSTIVIVKKKPDGTENSISIDTNELDGKETVAALNAMLSSD